MENEFFSLTTADLALRLRTTPGAIYQRRIREGGSYFGVSPRKLPNGRLLWPLAEAAAVFGGVPADLKGEPEAVRRMARMAKDLKVSITPGLVEIFNQLLGSSVANELEIEQRTGPIMLAMLDKARIDIERLPADAQSFDMSRITQLVGQLVATNEAIKEVWEAKLAAANASAAAR